MTAANATPVLSVYAIVDTVPDSLGLGVDGVSLWAVPGGGLMAVVGEHARPPKLGEDQLSAHEALIERLMDEAVVLPLRFGTTIGSEEELGGWLRSHEKELLERMELVRDAVELSVRAELPAADGNPGPTTGARAAASGTEYMRTRGRSIQAATQVRERLHDPLDELARRSVLFGPAPGSERFHAAYLVDGKRVEAFAAEVERLGSEFGLEVGCTGPWPPYSFVSGVGR